MGYVGTKVTQNIVSTSEITDGTITGDDLASDIAITTTGDTSLKGNVVINEDSADKDFRVESDASANALFVEGSSSNIGIGTASPNVIDGATNTHVDIRSDNSNYSFLQIGVTGTKTSSDVGYLEFLNGNNARLASISGGADGANNDGYLSLATLTGGSYTQKLKIDHDGHVTMPKQSSFHANFAGVSTQDNIAVGSAVTIAYANERYDVNGDYAHGSYTFTAPVTGKYLFNAVAKLEALDTDADHYTMHINTSNRDYIQSIVDPRRYSGDPYVWGFTGAVICDMDASDTATVSITQTAGSSQTDIKDGHWQGMLIS